MISKDHNNLIKDSLKYFLTKIIPGIMGLITIIVFVRIVGVAEYGKYSVKLSFITAYSALVIGWLNQSILRYYSKYQNNSQLPNIFTIGLSSSLILGALLMFVISGLTKNSGLFLLNITSLFLFLALCSFQFLSTVLRAQLRPNSVIKITVIQSILRFILPLLLLWYLTPDHKYLLIGLALSYIILPIFFFMKKKDRLTKLWSNFKNGNNEYNLILSKLFKYGFPLSLWLGIDLSLSFFDRFFIEYFYNYELTGIYASFHDLVIRIFGILLYPLALASHPRIMFAWNNNNESKALSIWRNALQYQLAIFIIFMTIIIIFSQKIFMLIMIALPELNITYSYLLVPTLLGSFLWQFAILCHKPLEMDKRTSLMVSLMIIALITNLCGNIIFLPRYGIIASAYTYIASGLIYILFSIYFSRKKYKMMLKL